MIKSISANPALIAGFFLLLSACTSAPKYKADDLLISPDLKRPISPTELTNEEVQADTSYLIYALDKAYPGQDFLPGSFYSDLIQNLKKINGPLSSNGFRDQIDEAMHLVPDYHLNASIDGQKSSLRNRSRRQAQVGKNIFQSESKPWMARLRNNILEISILGFPSHTDPVWNGFLEKIESLLPKSTATIIDLRGNDGGDDTKGLEMAWLFHAKDYRYPLSLQKERMSVEAAALYANTFAARIAMAKAQGRPFEHLEKQYQERMNIFNARKKSTESKYKEHHTAAFQAKLPLKTKLSAYQKPIYILMDAKCASSCESTIDAFEFHPMAKTIGENTGGYIHFGNAFPLLLPHSKIAVRIPTQYSEYYDKRFIEKTGITPSISVPANKDAYLEALKLIK